MQQSGNTGVASDHYPQLFPLLIKIIGYHYLVLNISENVAFANPLRLLIQSQIISDVHRLWVENILVKITPRL